MKTTCSVCKGECKFSDEKVAALVFGNSHAGYLSLVLCSPTCAVTATQRLLESMQEAKRQEARNKS